MSNVAMHADLFERLGKIALVGGGKMGEAIVVGLVQGMLLDPRAIEVAEPDKERCTYLTNTYGVSCETDGALLSEVTTALFAVKPQVFTEVAAHLSDSRTFNPERVISIAAGITTDTIAEFFPDAQIIRVMPNAPLMVSAGMSVISTHEKTSISEGELAVELFSLMGEALILPEDLINAATALSGSGPAYFALLVEELAFAGEQIGLSSEQAKTMAVQTLIGTARQLQLTDLTPAELREAVTSPGGTTQAALESLYAQGFGNVVTTAVKAADKRAEELSQYT